MSRKKIITVSIAEALALIVYYASLYMFHFGMISFWILPVISGAYGLFWAIKKITENSENRFDRGCAMKFYALTSAIFLPLSALCYSSLMLKVYAQLCAVGLVGSIYELYQGKRNKGFSDLISGLIETFLTNPEDLQKELSSLQQAFLLQAKAGAVFLILGIVGELTLSSEIFLTILLGVCITSVVVELIKDIALPSSKLESAYGQIFYQDLFNVST
ncbi:hypothetical protein [Wolbachia endosymbiont (group E) of Neria commutata]|uniref:hypothetical protein n=1 Tax=Wolbachia endosymbiont (group E) of Neria commutata TaxID=3066149 RepID=UPI003132BF2F